MSRLQRSGGAWNGSVHPGGFASTTKIAHVEAPQGVLQAIAAVVGGVARGAIMPSEDWVLISRIVGRPVNREEAAELYLDEEFWGEVEALAASVADK